MDITTKLLVIDDEPLILDVFECAFSQPEYIVQTAQNAAEGLAAFRDNRPDVVLMDVQMPDCTGLEALAQLQRLDPKIPIVLMTGHGTAATAIEAMRIGAFEYLLKPLQMENLTQVVTSAAETSRMTRTPAFLPSETPHQGNHGDCIVGSSRAMQEVYRAIGRVASRNVTVLILGESGTGKEVVARAIYQYSDRAAQRFLPVNCAAIPEHLLESELFGHEKGAFTGADRKRIGKFELASEGTLFLDEIGDMTPLMQTKILRVVQDQQFERVGGSESVQTDARLIAATNRDLAKAIADGSFRSDLFYRLNVYTIELPPLRERMEDLPELVDYFLYRYSHELKKPLTSYSPEALEQLNAYQWPGNIRELQSVIKRAVLEATGPVLVPAFLPDSIRRPQFRLASLSPAEPTPASPPTTESPLGRAGDNSKLARPITATALAEALEALAAQQLSNDSNNNIFEEVVAVAERAAIAATLRCTNGNLTESSRRLGISRTTLRAKMLSLQIHVDQNAVVNYSE
ncbi:sigma-54-dependent transcriptional regulator [Aureliella helgolandensis]|uniref:DNA-binding transcriptional regulator NtrC n=1 Tax=Aureliella helgolandensis TaxID=2527968 RepID=A0A518G9V3_9BACT|nr:sigma-54 dependent transcriptional regulator [Aureliella helgolandensis]QDV25349.1 Transcriptional regulatory protein ZraR [Aureliella helgolandensis]